MIVEIRGVGYENQGAALMLAAIADHFAAVDGRVHLAATPFRNGRRPCVPVADVLRKLPAPPFGRSALAMLLMSRWFRDAYRLVSDREIDAVLDASGFVFGDHWGQQALERAPGEAHRWKRQGKKIVFMPQAFGPFSRESTRSAFARVLEHADLVFARDLESYEHLTGLHAATKALRLAPDFTNLVAGAVPMSFANRPGRAAIVPNLHMIDRTLPQQSARYVPFLVTCIRELKRRGLEPFLLLHSTGDEQLGPLIQEQLGAELETVRESNPLHTKGILGTCCVAVASRYHALASCLAQRVPCIGTGWSHKYRFLFEDYGCAECLLSVDASADEIGTCVNAVLEEPSRTMLTERLTRAATRQIEQTHGMWREIDAVLALRSLHQ